MNFVCIVFELGDKMLTLSSMENLIVQCNLDCRLRSFGFAGRTPVVLRNRRSTRLISIT